MNNGYNCFHLQYIYKQITVIMKIYDKMTNIHLKNKIKNTTFFRTLPKLHIQ